MLIIKILVYHFVEVDRSEWSPDIISDAVRTPNPISISKDDPEESTSDALNNYSKYVICFMGIVTCKGNAYLFTVLPCFHSHHRSIHTIKDSIHTGFLTKCGMNICPISTVLLMAPLHSKLHH